MKPRELYTILCLIIVLVVPQFAFAASKEITFGLTCVLSGPTAPWGQGNKRSVELIVPEINAKGGLTLNGEKYMLKHKIYDHAADPARGVEVGKRLMEVDKVAWILTHLNPPTMALLPFTEEKKMICLHGTTGRDMIDFQKKFGGPKYNFKSMVLTPEVFYLGWAWASKRFPQWKTTVVLGTDDASGWAVVKDAKEALQKYGIKIGAETFYKRGTTDFYPVLANLLAAKPDVFDLAALPSSDQGRLIKQARELGYKGPFFAESASMIGPTLEIAGPLAEGLIFGSYVHPTSRFATKEERAWYDMYIKAYGEPYDLFSLSNIISVYIVVQAIEKANSLDSDKIADILRTTKFDILGRKVWMGGRAFMGLRLT